MRLFNRKSLILVAALFLVLVSSGHVLAKDVWSPNLAVTYMGEARQKCEKPEGCTDVCRCDSADVAITNPLTGKVSPWIDCSDTDTICGYHPDNKPFKFDVYKEDQNMTLLKRVVGNKIYTVGLDIDFSMPNEKDRCRVTQVKATGFENMCKYALVPKDSACCCKIEVDEKTKEETFKGCLPLDPKVVPLVSGGGELESVPQTLPECGAPIFNDQVSGFTYKRFPFPPAGQCSAIVTAEEEKKALAAGRDAVKVREIYKKNETLLAEAASKLNPLRSITGSGSAAVATQTLIGQIIRSLLAFVGSIALVLYIYAGVVWMSAAGNSDRVDMSKKTVLWTTLGLVVMLLSYVIVNAIFSLIG